MTNRLSELAKRVEELSGPDRELDSEIFRAIGAPVPFQWFNKIAALSYDEKQKCWTAPIGDMQLRYEHPAYTSSIDAAMTLVPEGYDWIVARMNGGLTIHACVGRAKEHFADTPALALCAAALRSLASEKSS